MILQYDIGQNINNCHFFEFAPLRLKVLILAEVFQCNEHFTHLRNCNICTNCPKSDVCNIEKSIHSLQGESNPKCELGAILRCLFLFKWEHFVLVHWKPAENSPWDECLHKLSPMAFPSLTALNWLILGSLEDYCFVAFFTLGVSSRNLGKWLLCLNGWMTEYPPALFKILRARGAWREAQSQYRFYMHWSCCTQSQCQLDQSIPSLSEFSN